MTVPCTGRPERKIDLQEERDGPPRPSRWSCQGRIDGIMFGAVIIKDAERKERAERATVSSDEIRRKPIIASSPTKRKDGVLKSVQVRTIRALAKWRVSGRW